ncbi:conjugative transfer protein trbJ [Vibrio ishigakensis]|uniref:Conjugative transfer protein trbJ n=1 Tax=Vibrio ishigakensis TaxID=1481914 RepID=A0A0B8PS82_9VIBR|nr:conjugative transfer protein trbJ [Vibrio ishigakensis]
MRSLAYIVPVLLGLQITPVQAFICANCATVVQMSQSNMTQTKSYLEDVQQTINSIQNLEYQIQNLQNLNNLEWGDIESHLQNLNTIASRGQSLSYAMGDVTERWNAILSVWKGMTLNPLSK